MELETRQPLSETVPATQTLLPASNCEKAAWLLMAAGILFVLHYQLVSALLAGLLAHALIRTLTSRLTGKRFTHTRARIIAAALVGLAAATLAAGMILLLIALIKGRLGDLPSLFHKMAEIVENARNWIKADWIPEAAGDADQLRASLAEWLRDHAQELQKAGGETVRTIFHTVVGIVVGALVSFQIEVSEGPLTQALFERVRQFASAFDKIVSAQSKISALNTALTATFLFIVLPLFGIHLPFRTTLTGITFVMGLLPVVGNLVSNSIIVIISLGYSLPVAVASLSYLVIIHKLEYFLNARIVGTEVRAAAWEILLAMFAFEAAFGIPGVILAPIVYAYVKTELTDRKLI